VAETTQYDSDSDGLGDACDPCPWSAADPTADMDGDGLADGCIDYCDLHRCVSEDGGGGCQVGVGSRSPSCGGLMLLAAMALGGLARRRHRRAGS
jgi:hypothetical protein